MAVETTGEHNNPRLRPRRASRAMAHIEGYVTTRDAAKQLGYCSQSYVRTLVRTYTNRLHNAMIAALDEQHPEIHARLAQNAAQMCAADANWGALVVNDLLEIELMQLVRDGAPIILPKEVYEPIQGRELRGIRLQQLTRDGNAYFRYYLIERRSLDAYRPNIPDKDGVIGRGQIAGRSLKAAGVVYKHHKPRESDRRFRSTRDAAAQTVRQSFHDLLTNNLQFASELNRLLEEYRVKQRPLQLSPGDVIAMTPVPGLVGLSLT